ATTSQPGSRFGLRVRHRAPGQWGEEPPAAALPSPARRRRAATPWPSRGAGVGRSTASGRAGVVQVRALPDLRRPDGLRRPPPQPPPALPDVPPRRPAPARRPGQPLPGADGPGRHPVPCEGGAGRAPPLQRLRPGAPQPRRRRRRPPRPAPPAARRPPRRGSAGGGGCGDRRRLARGAAEGPPNGLGRNGGGSPAGNEGAKRIM
ncbi:MAG: hypothetical protein AVDCRST_MAG19-4651, partial [uncultured Thermomicrobiales bacterium]